MLIFSITSFTNTKQHKRQKHLMIDMFINYSLLDLIAPSSVYELWHIGCPLYNLYLLAMHILSWNVPEWWPKVCQSISVTNVCHSITREEAIESTWFNN